MATPDDVPFDQRDWLELLSSIHFLRTTDQLDAGSTQERLDIEKPLLSPYTNRATKILSELGLIEE